MGFRQGAYATVWEVEPRSDSFTKMRISISRKNRETEQYEQDFSGYIACVGTAAARKAATLRERDRIKLGDVDVSTTYNAETHTTYTNFKVFSFEMADQKPVTDITDPQPEVDGGEPEEDGDDLPF